MLGDPRKLLKRRRSRPRGRMRRPSVLEGKDERTLKGVAVVTRDQGPTLPFASNKTNNLS